MKAITTSRSGRKGPLAVLSAIASVVLLAGACSPAKEGDSGSAGADDGANAPVAGLNVKDTYQDVLEQIKGLEGEARENKLIELANKEEAINIYTSNTQMQEQLDNFEDYYDGRLKIRPNLYRAPSDTMLARVLEEARAGFQGADLTEVHAPELSALHESGLLREYTSPFLEARDKDLNFGDWFVVRMNVMAVEWNTKQVKPADVPKSMEDLLDPKWKGKMLVESRAYDWFVTLWKYFEEQGWDDAKIEKYFRDLVANGRVQQGFPEQAELLTTGEASVLSGGYLHLVAAQAKAGAPVAFKPLVEPVIIDPTGVGLIKNAKNPAGAILLADYLLNQGQDLYREQNRMPPSELEAGGLLAGVEYRITDPKNLQGDEGQKWRDRWDAILQGQPFKK